MPVEVKRRYFELIREGWSGDGSQSGGSVVELWVAVVHRRWLRASSRSRLVRGILSQDDRIEIADGPARSEPVKKMRRADREVLLERSIGRSLETGRPIDATNPDSRTTRPICGAAGRSCAGSPWTTSCARWWPASCQTLVLGADQPLAAAAPTDGAAVEAEPCDGALEQSTCLEVDPRPAYRSPLTQTSRPLGISIDVVKPPQRRLGGRR